MNLAISLGFALVFYWSEDYWLSAAFAAAAAYILVVYVYENWR